MWSLSFSESLRNDSLIGRVHGGFHEVESEKSTKGSKQTRDLPPPKSRIFKEILDIN